MEEVRTFTNKIFGREEEERQGKQEQKCESREICRRSKCGVGKMVKNREEK